MANQLTKQEGFLFVQNYRTIEDALKEKHGDEAALDYYHMLFDYALDGLEPDPKQEGYMATVWEHVKPMVDEHAIEPKPPKWGSRLLRDLSDDELEELFVLYDNGVGYTELKEKFGMGKRTLSEGKILEAKREKRARDLRADAELLDYLVECSEIPEDEWLANVGTMDVSMESLREYACEDRGATLNKRFFEENYLGGVGGYDDYWRYLSKFVKTDEMSKMRK